MPDVQIECVVGMICKTQESASSLPPPKSKSLPPPSQPPTLKSPPPSPPPKSAAPPPEPSANLASPPPSSPLKPTFPPPTPEIVQAHAKSNENPIPAAVAGAPGQTIIANNAGEDGSGVCSTENVEVFASLRNSTSCLLIAMVIRLSVVRVLSQ